MWIFLLLFWAAPFEDTLKTGLEALQQNNLPAARAQLEEASRSEPKNPIVWLGLAQTYWRLHLTSLAGRAADRALVAGPDNPMVLHGLAYFYSESGDPGKAAALEEKYAATAPADAQALPRAAGLYLQAGRAAPAISLARRALAAEDRADLHHLLGQAYEMHGEPEKAASEMQAAIRLNRYEEAYYFDLGLLYLRHNSAAAAARVFEDGRTVFARSAQLELALGVAEYSLRRFEDAATCFLRTIPLAPQAEQPYVFLSRMLDQVEDELPQIKAAYAGFLKAQPENYLANFLYAKVLAVSGGDADEIEKLLRKSIALNEKFWQSHSELALLCERRRDFAAASAEYRRAIELDPENADLHYHLARIYERLGKKQEAVAEHAAHERLSSAESAAIKRQQGALTGFDLSSK